MIQSRHAWMFAGVALCALMKPAYAVSTGTIIRISGDQYTLDVGKADGLANGQEIRVLKNGEIVGRLQVTALREHEADAKLLESTPDVIIRVGDTVAFEPSAPVTPPPAPEPPAPEPPTPEPPTPQPPTPQPPAPQPPTPETPSVPVPPPASEDDVAATLTELGFENVVATSSADGGVYVEFENRRFRWEIEALGIVMRAVESHGGAGPMTLVGKVRNIPIYRVETTQEDFRAFLDGTMPESDFKDRLLVNWPETRGQSGTNHSYRRIDLTIGNGYRADFSTLPGQKAPGIQTRIRLGMESDLAKGLRARFREWIPLNRASGFDRTPSVDTGEVSYLRKFGNRLYGLASVGQFEERFSGVRGEANFFVSRDDAVSVQAGQVGNGLSDLKRFAYTGTWRHQLPKADAQVFAQAGKYLGGDSGARFGFSARFREREYEFAYTKTDIDKLLTFTLRWPLGIPAYSPPRSFRLRSERQLRIRYFSKSAELGQAFPDEGVAENWQAAALPATLPQYLSFLRGRQTDGSEPVLMSGVQDLPLRALIGTNTTGSTGLWFIPAAEVEPYGYWTLGANWVDRKYRSKAVLFGGKGTVAEYFTFGALPRLEITLRLTNQAGKLGAQRYSFPGTGTSSSGWNVDRMVSAQYLLWNEKGSRPAVLVGGQDFLGDLGSISTSVAYKAYYGVASKHIAGFGVHVGVGTDTLKGAFFGLDRPLSGRIRALGDVTRGNATLGVRVEAVKNVRVDVYAPGLNTFGAGFTYTRRM